MKNRREFIQHTSLTIAGLAIAPELYALQASSPSMCDAAIVLDEGCKDVFIPAAEESKLFKRLNVEWQSIVGPRCWHGHNIQMHSRYTPSAEGIDLRRIGIDSNMVFGSKNAVFQVLPTAVVTGVRPHAMLINLDKLGRHLVEGLTLSDFAKKNIKPTFTVNPFGSSAENSWLLPVFHSAGLVSECPSDLDKSAADVQRLAGLVDSCLSHLDVPVTHGIQGSEYYSALTDASRVDSVALYGDPILLQQTLNTSESSASLASDYAIVSLQDYLGMSEPSLFPSQLMQVGHSLALNGVADVVRDLVKPLTETDAMDVASAGTVPNEQREMLREQWSTLLTRHEPHYYDCVAGIEVATDGGLLAKLMIDLQAAAHLFDSRDPSYVEKIAAYALERSIRAQKIRHRAKVV